MFDPRMWQQQVGGGRPPMSPMQVMARRAAAARFAGGPGQGIIGTMDPPRGPMDPTLRSADRIRPMGRSYVGGYGPGQADAWGRELQGLANQRYMRDWRSGERPAEGAPSWLQPGLPRF